MSYDNGLTDPAGQKFELEVDDSTTLQLRQDLVSTTGLVVSVPETLVLGEDYNVVGGKIVLTTG